jgi:hypothetical protein
MQRHVEPPLSAVVPPLPEREAAVRFGGKPGVVADHIEARLVEQSPKSAKSRAWVRCGRQRQDLPVECVQGGSGTFKVRACALSDRRRWARRRR